MLHKSLLVNNNAVGYTCKHRLALQHGRRNGKARSDKERAVQTVINANNRFGFFKQCSVIWRGLLQAGPAA